MLYFRLVFLLLVVFSSALSAFAQDDLKQNFQSPPDSAKPHTWWHWMNGYVSAEGITADLEAMQRSGIGGFQAFQIERNMSPGPVKYLGPQWRRLMKHTLKEADRLGLEVCYHNCAGWSSSGGPWITPEYAMQNVVWTEQQVTGATKLVKLQRPKDLRDDYFQDIAVLAFPTPKSELGDKTGFRVDNWKAKAGYERDNQITPDTRDVSSDDSIELESIVNLTGKMDASGKLNWKVPEGDWTIVRFGHAVCGLRNRPAPKEGRGSECDKMSKAAAAWHWKHTVQKVIDDAGPLVGKSLKHVLIDSYETGQQNWTPGFDTEFQRRLGYDVIQYLPAFTGRVIEDLDHTERFLWDLRRVIADMWTENYYGHFAEMCHKNGLLLASEPYGVPGNLDDFAVADIVDIPMGEWWARTSGGPFKSSAKLAASTAHTNGRKFVGAEAFTAGRATAAFVQYPYNLKAQGDYYFCQGVNRFYFHTMVHQPWANDVLPGMTMGPWGFQNNRNNTWYEQGRAWNQYLARSQYLLQQGTFQADLCYFPGENAPQTLATRENMNPPVPQGYDYDTISRNNFMKLTVENGRIVLPGLMQYRVLVMPAGPVRSDVFEKAQRLLEDGGHLVWAKPEGTPGLKGFPQSDQAMRQVADKIWGDCDGIKATENVVGKGKVHWPGPLSKISMALNVGPDVEFQSIQPIAATLAGGVGYEWIHRKVDSADVYLVSNQQEVARQVEVVFRSQGRAAQLWNAETGEIQQAPVYEPTDDGRTRVKLFMEPAEAVFVVFDKPSDSASVVDILHNGSTPFSNPAPKPKQLTIIKAVYGDLDGDASRQADVTKRIRSEVANNMLQAEVKFKLVGVDPAFGTVKILRVQYALDDAQFTTVVKQNETIILNRATDPVAAPDEPATLSVSAGEGVLNAWQAGDYELVFSDGNRKQLQVPSIPEPVDLSSDWNLQCPKDWGPANVKLDKLMSWTQHEDPELKYFSGTAVYQKQFDVPENRLGDDHSVRLDLGNVQIIAEVILNGKNLGTLWKPPYVVDVSGLVQPKNNQLEIRVTNLWVNRLIGDEQFPSPYEYEPNEKPGEGLILKIPDWLEGKGKRPETQAKTFTVWKFHTKDSPLLDSGLIGPVQLEFAVQKPFDLQSTKTQ